jgi:Mitochondrial fission ELM1
MDLSQFDLVVTTPQYGLPAAANVIELELPFAHPKAVGPADLEAFSAEWAKLPRPWLLGVIGGAKFPQRLNEEDLAAFGASLHRRAVALGGSVILLDSPRSPEGGLDKVAASIAAPKWLYRRGQSVNPYQAALSLCDECIVTSDSVSMVAEMLFAGKPTAIYRLPVQRFLPRWTARHGLAATVAKAGMLHPPRDVDGFMQGLIGSGVLGDISKAMVPRASAELNVKQRAVVARIKTLLATSPSYSSASSN